MQSALLCQTYFPNIAYLCVFAQYSNVLIEAHDSYQKQTFRNRTLIYAANGVLPLTIPVHFTQKKRQLYRDVKVVSYENWQSTHLKSLQSAYRTSPFYEHYEDAFVHLFERKIDYLFDFNQHCLEVLLDCLDLNSNISKTESFVKNPSNADDYRALVHPSKTNSTSFDSYLQVFQPKHGFKQNLSGLDLLFNEGPNALNYLKQQDVSHLITQG